jgi:hypothetical protein
MSEGSRKKKSDGYQSHALVRHARKGELEEEPVAGGSLRRMMVRMCSRVEESSL